LVIGVNGQDGGLLAEELLRRAEPVIGLGLRTAPAISAGDRFTYVQVDLRDPAALTAVLADCRPRTVFHFAAVHGPDGAALEDLWVDAFHVNVASLQACLEHARRRDPEMRLVYASSSRIFGDPLHGRLSHETAYAPCDLYGVTKNMACDLIALYREQHGVDAAAVHLFNHESDRRDPRYFIPKLVAAAAAARSGRAASPVRSLDFHCDWGDAAEYMMLIARFAQAPRIADCVLASGETWFAQDLAAALFARFDLDWRDHLDVAPAPPRPAPFQADPGLFAKLAGAAPQRSILDLCAEMVRRRSD